MTVFQSKREKQFTYFVFGIYLLLLCWLVLFKFATSIDEIPHLRGINLIPFYYGSETSFHASEVGYNVLAFVPAGFYFTALTGKKKAGILASFLLSVFFETVQWIFAIGASDITDVITNTLGGLCGLLLFVCMGKLTSKYRMRIINILGLVIEVLGCGLLAVLLIANA